MSSLMHYGIKRRSGRYPWGSGEDGFQRGTSFRGHVNELKKQGYSESKIAEGFGMSTKELRARISIEKDMKRRSDTALAISLKDKGYSTVAIGERMGINESSVRNLLNPILNDRASVTESTMKMLKDQVEQKTYLDIGAGVEQHMGLTRTKLDTAIVGLELEGYRVQYVTVDQLGTGKKTTIKVLRKKLDGEDDDPEIAKKAFAETHKNKENIKTIKEWTEDGGRTYLGIQTPKSVDSSRIAVRYKEDGGSEKDGVIELRRDAKDLSLGKSRYAQVRIAVDDTHYLKGMAVYSDDLPDGVDIMFNTNKSSTGNKLDALKKMKDDADNPFGATIRQREYIDDSGKKTLSPINIVNEEGEWSSWSKTLSSQMGSKQPAGLIQKQLNIALAAKREEFDEYNSLTNPAVKKKLLATFADECDSAAVHLKAAGMPRQGNFVILPLSDIKENEVYAPKYRDGERLVLIRHPHGGIFEIPDLVVNNKSKQGRRTLGSDAEDAIGIHYKTAQKLSGADFDGDSVIAIPGDSGVRTAPSLVALRNFDPQEAYPGYEGMPVMTPKNKQSEMGKISNLITDMTIKGANTDDIAKAVKHSMVVIDAEKHKLNYKQSFIDNNIAALKEKYQGGAKRGASTLISRASSEIRVDQRQDAYRIDPDTGAKIFIKTGASYINKDGKLVKRQTVSTRMYEVDDAHELSSGTKIEQVYAEYANSMKRLGDQARLITQQTPNMKQSPSAKVTYKEEVDNLKAQLSIAKSNAPLERQAQLFANKIVAMKQASKPDMDKDDLKKVKGQALNEARLRVGAKKESIEISPKQWEAIQAGAISNSVLVEILNNTNIDVVKQYATPRTERSALSDAQIARAKTMRSRGLTQAQIADSLGVSTSTISNALKGE